MFSRGMSLVGKNGISVKLIASSISNDGAKITSLQLRYPRLIHSELMTHRVFSRNAASSRAIPVATFIDQVLNDPATPLHFGLNQSGMQAQQEEVDLEWAHSWWKRAAASAAELANEANGRNLHKQVANRILEPFQFMTTLVTSTDWDNFMLQRVSAFADPNLEHLASLMKKVLEQHTPDRTRFHLPYITLDEDGYSMEEKMKISAARCCRVSYNRAGESSTLDADIDRHNSLVASGHWSPFEHVAIALDDAEWRSGNFEGWHQYRNILQGVLPVAVTRKAFNLNLLLG